MYSGMGNSFYEFLDLENMGTAVGIMQLSCYLAYNPSYRFVQVF